MGSYCLQVLGASPVKQFSTEFDVVDDERMNENIFSKKRNFEITRSDNFHSNQKYFFFYPDYEH